MLSWHSILKIKEKNLFFQYDSWNRIIKSAKSLPRTLNVTINTISTKKKKFVLKNRLISQLQWKKIPSWEFLDTFWIKALDQSKDRRCRMSTQSCSRTRTIKTSSPLRALRACTCFSRGCAKRGDHEEPRSCDPVPLAWTLWTGLSPSCHGYVCTRVPGPLCPRGLHAGGTINGRFTRPTEINGEHQCSSSFADPFPLPSQPVVFRAGIAPISREFPMSRDKEIEDNDFAIREGSSEWWRRNRGRGEECFDWWLLRGGEGVEDIIIFFSLDLTRDVRRVICRWFIFYEIISRGKKRWCKFWIFCVKIDKL